MGSKGSNADCNSELSPSWWHTNRGVVDAILANSMGHSACLTHLRALDIVLRAFRSVCLETLIKKFDMCTNQQANKLIRGKEDDRPDTLVGWVGDRPGSFEKWSSGSLSFKTQKMPKQYKARGNYGEDL